MTDLKRPVSYVNSSIAHGQSKFPGTILSFISTTIPSDVSANEKFGESVAAGITHIAVGAPGDDGTGSVHMYKLIDTDTISDSDKQVLKGSDISNNSEFGKKVLMGGDKMIATTADNKIYYFEKNSDGTWPTTETMKIAPMNPADDVSSNRFGESLAMDSSSIVVGAPGMNGSGGVFVYNTDDLSNNNLMIEYELHPQDASGITEFGKKVAIDNGNIFALSDLSGIIIVNSNPANETFPWNEITTTGTKPIGRQAFSSILYNGKMVIFGGYYGTGATRLNDVWTLDLTTFAWTEITTTGTKPSGRYGQSSILYKGQMVIFGGFSQIVLNAS